MAPSRSVLELDALRDVVRIVGGAADLTKALTSTLQVLRTHLGLENGTVSLLDPVTGEVFIEAAPELPDAERIRRRLRPGEGLVGQCFRHGLPIAVPDAGAEPALAGPLAPDADAAGRVQLAVPLRGGGNVLGVLTAERPPGAAASVDGDLRLLAVVAGVLAPHILLRQTAEAEPEPEEEAPPVAPEGRPGDAVGESARWRAVLDMVARVAPSRATVLLRGESGTGKEVVARALHEHSPRARRPFVAVSCAALPETLLESELFGHERGAFTGAATAKAGRFEQADGGTLFLDEVGELPATAQVKLLRALQEREFERVGGGRTLTVDVRVIAATNSDLEAAVRAGSFRLDLYHRLQVVEITLPPLRDRPEDVPLLASHFLAQLNAEHGRRVQLDRGAIGLLRRYPWPGNVRQLRNAIERLVVSHPAGLVTAADLDWLPAAELAPLSAPAAPGSPLAPMAAPVSPPETAEADAPDADERERILEALRRAGWVQARAARLLGMTVRQIRYRIAKHSIEVERF